MTDLVVIGAGTAGLSAAIYGHRAGLEVLVLETLVYGGQIINTPDVQNYPGIPSVSGAEFATGLYRQALALGAAVVTEGARSLRAQGSTFVVATGKREIECRAVILATGARNRPLGVEHEEALIGAGISYCATCDGMFFRGKDVAVVGGGSTAVEDALFLSGICRHVTLIHRRQGFRAEDTQVERLRQKENVTFVLDSVVTGLNGRPLSDIEIRNVITEKTDTLAVSALFVAVGQMPDNGAFSPPVVLDEQGYIVAGEDCKSNVPGVFAAGDGRTKTVRQLVTAAADGAVAALAAAEHIRRAGGTF